MKKQKLDPEIEGILRAEAQEEEADRSKHEDGDNDDNDEDDPQGARNAE